jgi:hypothetical protein
MVAILVGVMRLYVDAFADDLSASKRHEAVRCTRRWSSKRAGSRMHRFLSSEAILY